MLNKIKSGKWKVESEELKTKSLSVRVESRVKSKTLLPKKRLTSRLKNVSLLTIIILFAQKTEAQCAMCRAVLESEESTAQAEAINDGIVYLMIIPYLLVAVAGYAIYKIKYGRKRQNENA